MLVLLDCNCNASAMMLDGDACVACRPARHISPIPFFFFAFIVPPLSLSLSPLLSIRLNKAFHSLIFIYYTTKIKAALLYITASASASG